MTDHLESARAALRHARGNLSNPGALYLADALAAVVTHLETTAKPANYADMERALEDALRRATSAESRLAEAKESVRNHDSALNKVCGRADKAESALAASEQAREGMARVVEAAQRQAALERQWQRCPLGSNHPEVISLEEKMRTAKTDLAAAVDALASPPRRRKD